MEKLLAFIPKGQGTYITLAGGVVVVWIIALVPGAGDLVGIHAMSASEAWSATWQALTAAFFRRAMA